MKRYKSLYKYKEKEVTFNDIWIESQFLKGDIKKIFKKYNIHNALGVDSITELAGSMVELILMSDILSSINNELFMSYLKDKEIIIKKIEDVLKTKLSRTGNISLENFFEIMNKTYKKNK